MSRKKKRRGDRFFVGLLLLDQLLKWFSLNFGVVVFNQGISLGLLPIDWPIALILLAIIFLGIWFKKTGGVGERLIIIGGLSNLIDRLVFGRVVDYISFSFIDLWVNLGDVYINVGLVWLLFSAYRLSSLYD